jgi:hypothetical protein
MFVVKLGQDLLLIAFASEIASAATPALSVDV